jgi:hypothetical protein
MARSSISLGLFILMICSVISAAVEDPPKGQAAVDWPNDPATLLKRLKDRDAELDNRSVETEQRWVERVSPRAQIAANRFDARRFGQPDPGSPPEDKIPADFDQPHRLRRLLTVREPAVTIERLNDLEKMKHPEYVAIPNRGCRWSSAGGVERVWSPETNDLHILGAPADDGLLRWDAHMLQWSSGYGLARWIESIDSVKVEDGKLTAKGRMRLMGYDASRVELILDRDLIVRRMALSVPGKDGGGSNDYVVETRGTVRPAGCPPVAESGRFRRVVKPEGKPESVYQDYEFRFVAASARLTDEEYGRLTRIEPGPKAVTIDARRKR